MNDYELSLLARRLQRIANEAFPHSQVQDLPASVRRVVVDVYAHPASQVGQIAERTGFPQSRVSTSVALLCERGLVETAKDPDDRRRTLVHPSKSASLLATENATAAIDSALATELGTDDPNMLAEAIAHLEALAKLFTRSTLQGRTRLR